jgi:hypothetical protein
MDIKETRYDHMDWIHLLQDTILGRTLVNMAINLPDFQGMFCALKR